MSDDRVARQALGSAKPRPQWRPLDSLRTAMVKQVFAREHFTHKKGLLFTPMVHTDEGTQADAPDASLADEAPGPTDAPHQAAPSTPEATPDPAPAESAAHPSIEDIRAQAFAEGLAQGLAQGQQQAQQAQAANEQEQLTAQTNAHTQTLLNEIDQQVAALVEDPAQLQEPLKRLALHLAEQLVLGELSFSPQAIERLMERCIETLDASDAATLVVDLNPQDMALLQSQTRPEGQSPPAWRFHADHSLLPGSVRVRADDAVVSDLIENRLESLAHSLLKDTQAWESQSAFAPSKLASRLASQRGSAHTVEDAQAKPHAMRAEAPQTAEPLEAEPLPESAAFDDSLEHEAHDEDLAEMHTYEPHALMDATPPPPEAMTKKFADALTDISLELDKHDD